MTLYKLTFAETQEFFKIAKEIAIFNKMSPTLQKHVTRWRKRREESDRSSLTNYTSHYHIMRSVNDYHK